MVLQDFIKKTNKFDRRVVHHKNTTITQKDPDILAEATIGNCGIVLPMTEHNKNAELDLTNVVYEEIVDNCFNTPRSATDIMVAIYSRNMTPQVLAETFLSSLQIAIHERDIIEKKYSKTN